MHLAIDSIIVEGISRPSAPQSLKLEVGAVYAGGL